MRKTYRVEIDIPPELDEKSLMRQMGDAIEQLLVRRAFNPEVKVTKGLTREKIRGR